jgi:selT/selW/selH-like putative selenoprotein
MQIKNYIERKYPDIDVQISGSYYPPSYNAVVISKFTTYLWYAGLALLVLGEHIFKALRIDEPNFYKQMKQNPYVAFIGLFILNSYGNSMLSTGAFEVTLDGVEIFSKLKTGSVPSELAILDAMKQAGLTFNSRLG